MSILSQAAVVLLILFIISVLIKSNHELDQAAISGESFADSWAIAQAKKEEYILTGTSGEEEAWEMALTDQEIMEEGGTFSEEKEKEELDARELRSVEPVMGFLLLDEENHPDRSVMIDHVPFSIGHSPENDLVLDDLSVSKKHCLVDEEDGRYYLEDLGTGTGLYVDGKRTDKTVMERGMHISIGGSELIVEMKMERSAHTRLNQR